ncbi:MAG TPA: hypothetical protein VGO76_10330 [Luteibacter sp.]|jgi:hypothetical protein|nr:hypothetical protein [Luteibacter sp.]
MPMIRLLLTGSRDNADTVINALHGIEDVEHVEEVDDLTPQMRDDSSSSELTDDDGPGIYYIEVDTPNERVADTVKLVAEATAMNLEAAVEFVDNF